MLFTVDPWATALHYISHGPLNLPITKREEAASYVRQSKEYFVASQHATIEGAKPTLHYYSILNLAKTLVLVRDSSKDLRLARHGVTESGYRLEDASSPGRQGVTHASVRVKTSPQDESHRDANGNPTRISTIQIADELNSIVTGLPNGSFPNSIQVKDLLSQVVIGHRLWADAERTTEKFVRVDPIQVVSHQTDGSIWLRLHIEGANLERAGLTVKELIRNAGLEGKHHQVVPPSSVSPTALVLEGIDALKHARAAVDGMRLLVEQTRSVFSVAVMNAVPYKKYYLHAASDRAKVVNQLSAILVFSHFCSELSRYAPQKLSELLTSKYGAFVHEFANVQAVQFAYQVVSEICKKDVAMTFAAGA